LSFPNVPPVRIRSVEPIALETALGRSVVTPFATVRTTVALLVVVRDEDGEEGWGEIWCSFPRFGHRHRARLVAEVMAPLLAGRTFASPEEAWRHLHAATRLLRLQSGEIGPMAAVIAGIDLALWDLAGKRAGQPLWRLLGGRSATVPVYASLGRADDQRATLERCRDEGYRAFKVRSVGGIDEHLGAVRSARGIVGTAAELMLDVNATWDVDDAIATVGALADARLAWLEEPIPQDAPEDAWQRLAQAAPMPLAGGENLVTPAMFDAALAGSALAVLQPDATKWGGISGSLPLARRIVAAGRRYCPHSFAGAPGLLASGHLLSASLSRDGVLEVGVGAHPARDGLADRKLVDGALRLPDAPGLGLTVNAAQLARYRVGP
jgi:L-alanine-DL-glutamate epimerase-like enolase superfamily enzyme